MDEWRKYLSPSHDTRVPRMASQPAEHERVACPNCAARLPFAVMNEHLDRCLQKTPSPEKKRPAQNEAPRCKARRTTTLPFAERMRPHSLDEYVGQDEVVRGSLRALLRLSLIHISEPTRRP